MISHVLIYRVLEDSCLDCHYTSCQPYGHTVPKGGGICAPFKYIRADGDSYKPSSSMCKKKLPYNPHGGATTKISTDHIQANATSSSGNLSHPLLFEFLPS